MKQRYQWFIGRKKDSLPGDFLSHRLIRVPISPVLKNLLYGNETYSTETNKIAFSVEPPHWLSSCSFTATNIDFTLIITVLFFCSVLISQSSTCKKAVL